jgi:hypothetical protein
MWSSGGICRVNTFFQSRSLLLSLYSQRLISPPRIWRRVRSYTNKWTNIYNKIIQSDAVFKNTLGGAASLIMVNELRPCLQLFQRDEQRNIFGNTSSDADSQRQSLPFKNKICDLSLLVFNYFLVFMIQVVFLLQGFLLDWREGIIICISFSFCYIPRSCSTGRLYNAQGQLLSVFRDCSSAASLEMLASFHIVCGSYKAIIG